MINNIITSAECCGNCKRFYDRKFTQGDNFSGYYTTSIPWCRSHDIDVTALNTCKQFINKYMLD